MAKMDVGTASVQIKYWCGFMNVGMISVQMKFWRGFMNVGTASVRMKCWRSFMAKTSIGMTLMLIWSVDVTSWLHECWHGVGVNGVLTWFHECWHDFSKCWHSFMAKMNVGTALVQMEFWHGFMNVDTASIQKKCCRGFMEKMNVGTVSVSVDIASWQRWMSARLWCKWSFDMASWMLARL